MVVVAEFPVVRRAAIERLLADSGPGGVATLTGSRIFRNLAPKNTDFPYVAVYDLSSENLLTANAIHVQQDVQILVKVIDRGTSDVNLNVLGNRVVERLDMYGEVAIAGVYIVRFRWVSSQSQPDEMDGDTRYMYLNHVFKTEAYPG